MSEFTFYVMLIFLPGIISYIVFEQLTEHREHRIHETTIYSFLFGCLSYLIYYVLLSIIELFTGYQIPFFLLYTLKDIENAVFGEIVAVSCLSIFISVGLSTLDNYKLLHRFALSVGISRKHGELDTFTFLMNSNLRENAWIIVRDVENDFAYYGWLHTFSAGHEKNELFLVDVEVYNNTTGKKLMHSPGIYLSKPKEKYIIEFPTLPSPDIINKTIRKED